VVKSTYTTPAPRKPRPFPKLMKVKNGDRVIMAIEQYDNDNLRGMLLAGEEGTHKIGTVYDRWVASAFEDFEGRVTLENN